MLCDFLVGISEADLLTVLRATLFQVENTTDHAIDWNVHYYFTAFAGWSELASLAVNGQLVRADSQTGSAFATLSLPAHQVSNIIAVAGSGSPAGNICPAGCVLSTNCWTCSPCRSQRPTLCCWQVWA